MSLVSSADAGSGVPREPSLGETLGDRRICVCVGAGGVGKTTSAAAIAVGLAAEGRRVALVTIDPSRRLAGALGLSELGNEPRRLTPEQLAPAGIEIRGELWAMVLDPKRTFDELITRLAPDERARERVFANHIYRQISNAVGGSHEFTAVAKLYELDRDGSYDAIVLDTPPSRNALDFLRAPLRLMQFFDAPALRLLLAPAGLGARVAGRAAAPVLALLRRLVGVDLLAEIALFFSAIGSLIGGFRERASAVEALLHDPATTFVLVSSAEREPIREAVAFASALRDSGLPLGAIVVNRVHDQIARAADPRALTATLRSALGARLGRLVEECLADARRLAQRDELGMQRLRSELLGIPATVVPQLDPGLGEVALLGAVARRMFGEQAQLL
jgi:anion-transporting  ArsA/GET3 family ATPase